MAPPQKCRCGGLTWSECRTCYAREYARRVYRDKAYGRHDPDSRYISAARSVAHILDLRRKGVGVNAIATAAGVGRRVVQNLATGEQMQVAPETERKLLTVNARDHILRVPPYRAERRLQALNAIGYTTRGMAEGIGTTQQMVERIMAGHRKWIDRRTFERIDAYYQGACMTPAGNAQSITNAVKKGYAPPLAWDDIDDPDETPAIRSDRPVFADSSRITEVRELVALGVGMNEAARRIGVTRGSLERYLQRHKAHDLYARLSARDDKRQQEAS